jgi:hypothetical protein
MLDEDGNPIEDTKTTVTDEGDDDAAAKAAADAAREEAKNKTKETEDKGKKTSDEAAKLLKEVMALKAKLKEKDSAVKAIEEKYSGIDLEAAREALKAAEEAETKELERKGEYERLLAKQKEKADALIEAEKQRVKEMEEKLQAAMRSVDELSLGNAFAHSKFIQEKLALTPNKTRALYAQHFDIEDGKLVAYDKPKGATDRTPLISATGEPLSFDDAIAEIINNDPDKEYLLKAEGRQGAGSKASNVKADLEKKTYTDTVSKIAAGLANEKNFAPRNLNN